MLITGYSHLGVLLIIWVSGVTFVSTAASQRTPLYPYGLQAGDRAATRSDDHCDIAYNQHLAMFGRNFSRIYVCTNGAISLDKPYTKFTPLAFPLNTSDRAPLICPFWADANPGIGGNVFSRISRDTDLLQQASDEVKDGYRTGDDANFLAEWMLIATWDKVKAYGTNDNKTNTFQAIIVSDNVKSFVFFLYEQIQWTMGTSSNGVAAQVGFDSGDGSNFYATPESRTNRTINIASQSTVGVPGRMLFKLAATAPAPTGNETSSNATQPQGIVLPDKPLPTTTIFSNTTSVPPTSQGPVLFLLSDMKDEDPDNTTDIVVTVVTIILILLAAVVTTYFIVNKRVKVLRERKQREKSEIRRFSYLVT